MPSGESSMMAWAASNAASLALASARPAEMSLNMVSPEACEGGWVTVSKIDLGNTNHEFQFNLSQCEISNGHTLIVYRVGDTK
ncbi:hypothetical protein [Azospirillum brasilense]|uniref:hypothetical protein n=1 Tax=Azospirillum brasilense TaxID=192 RepID=UPI00190ADA2E|nr:hypothetical protein [Azospirillum brasilense]